MLITWPIYELTFRVFKLRGLVPVYGIAEVSALNQGFPCMYMHEKYLIKPWNIHDN